MAGARVFLDDRLHQAVQESSKGHEKERIQLEETTTWLIKAVVASALQPVPAIASTAGQSNNDYVRSLFFWLRSASRARVCGHVLTRETGSKC